MEMVMRSYPNDWVADSIMHRKGIGGGSSGVTQELTEEKQGTYLYTIGPYADPVLSIRARRPGDRRDPRCLRRARSRARATSPSELTGGAVSQPAMRPDLRGRRPEGRRARPVHIESMAPRADPSPAGPAA